MLWFQCVERIDLAGMDFIWRIAMETPDEEIANEAIQLIITYSYTNLNPKMKKVWVYFCIYCSGLLILALLLKRVEVSFNRTVHIKISSNVSLHDPKKSHYLYCEHFGFLSNEPITLNPQKDVLSGSFIF